jgi:hypothetical protein
VATTARITTAGAWTTMRMWLVIAKEEKELDVIRPPIREAEAERWTSKRWMAKRGTRGEEGLW